MESAPGGRLVSKVLSWRAAAAIAWSVLLLPLSTFSFIFLSRISLLHPVQWATDSLQEMYNSYTAFSLLVLAGIVVTIGTFNTEFYTVEPSIPCSRIALLGSVFHPQRLLHSVVHAALGVLTAWCTTVLVGGRYHLMSAPSSQDSVGVEGLYLNEFHVFLLVGGAFFGYSYSLRYFINNMNYLSFPAIQQFKYLRFKASLWLVVKYSAVQSFYFLRNYCLLYYFLGYVPRAWISASMSLQKDSSVPALDTLSGLLDPPLLYVAWLSGTFLLLTWYLTWLLFKIFITEVYQFPVQLPFGEDADRCLPRVLTSKVSPLVKCLALQDLALLSQYSPCRRQEVFSLSQPGGHPHHWTAISSECLALLRDLTHTLTAYQEVAAGNGRVKAVPLTAEKRALGSSAEALGYNEAASYQPALRTSHLSHTPRSSPLFKSSNSSVRSLLSFPFTPDLSSPFVSPMAPQQGEALDMASPCYGSLQSPHVMRRGPKLWTSASRASGCIPTAEDYLVPVSCPTPETVRPSGLSHWLLHRQEQLPEASSQAVFANSQIHIWALEGLSHLTAASFTEDRYGVVQTTLASILSVLLSLQEAVDKHFKLPHACSRPARASGSLADSSYRTLRFALRSALKTSIYRITSTFGEHLGAVQVSGEHRKRLQQFLTYKV
ncbi:nucleoporin NDC1 isoform X2 [Callorhinchus milii]|uniref:Nucleoporin NDC1 n=1 Tax=Callorhinchus milii TaxID=7868 RepID=A0A4W3ID52_CALMI|nr:nucleoporin NDC1 isoform X2 [Callorhinchus milii]|eukprot:gi/632980658/ref/XP_007907157.1/ PREDICTED: nucleoporin NDC1 isoform X2 [Callorhinchus milii]